jgi:phage-related protein
MILFGIVNFKDNFVERKIEFYGGYFTDFYVQQTVKVQEKIDFVFRLIQTVDVVPERFLKHLTGTDGLYEIRVACGNNIFRIFCCFDRGNVVVLFNAFQKKTQKTPKQEISFAERLMKDYFEGKEKGKVAGQRRK